MTFGLLKYNTPYTLLAAACAGQPQISDSQLTPFAIEVALQQQPHESDDPLALLTQPYVVDSRLLLSGPDQRLVSDHSLWTQPSTPYSPSSPSFPNDPMGIAFGSKRRSVSARDPEENGAAEQPRSDGDPKRPERGNHHRRPIRRASASSSQVGDRNAAPENFPMAKLIFQARLGSGGNSDVYRVTLQENPQDEDDSGRVFAAKKVKFSATYTLKDLYREVFILKSIGGNKGIPKFERLIVHNNESGQPEIFIVMEYIHGFTLDDLFNKFEMGYIDLSDLSFGNIIKIFKDVTLSLQHAYYSEDEEGKEFSLIHRDVKPSNIMVGQRGSIRLVDWGLSSDNLSDSELSDDGTLKIAMGTDFYYAPEIPIAVKEKRSYSPNPKSDVFSLGLVAIQMFAWYIHKFSEGSIEIDRHLPSLFNSQVERLNAIHDNQAEKDPIWMSQDWHSRAIISERQYQAIVTPIQQEILKIFGDNLLNKIINSENDEFDDDQKQLAEDTLKGIRDFICGSLAFDPEERYDLQELLQCLEKLEEAFNKIDELFSGIDFSTKLDGFAEAYFSDGAYFSEIDAPKDDLPEAIEFDLSFNVIEWIARYLAPQEGVDLDSSLVPDENEFTQLVTSQDTLDPQGNGDIGESPDLQPSQTLVPTRTQQQEDDYTGVLNISVLSGPTLQPERTLGDDTDDANLSPSPTIIPAPTTTRDVLEEAGVEMLSDPIPVEFSQGGIDSQKTENSPPPAEQGITIGRPSNPTVHDGDVGALYDTYPDPELVAAEKTAGVAVKSVTDGAQGTFPPTSEQSGVSAIIKPLLLLSLAGGLVFTGAISVQASGIDVLGFLRSHPMTVGQAINQNLQGKDVVADDDQLETSTISKDMTDGQNEKSPSDEEIEDNDSVTAPRVEARVQEKKQTETKIDLSKTFPVRNIIPIPDGGTILKGTLYRRGKSGEKESIWGGFKRGETTIHFDDLPEGIYTIDVTYKVEVEVQVVEEDDSERKMKIFRKKEQDAPTTELQSQIRKVSGTLIVENTGEVKQFGFDFSKK